MMWGLSTAAGASNLIIFCFYVGNFVPVLLLKSAGNSGRQTRL